MVIKTFGIECRFIQRKIFINTFSVDQYKDDYEKMYNVTNMEIEISFFI